jgi:hypothetical protein
MCATCRPLKYVKGAPLAEAEEVEVPKDATEEVPKDAEAVEAVNQTKSGMRGYKYIGPISYTCPLIPEMPRLGDGPSAELQRERAHKARAHMEKRFLAETGVQLMTYTRTQFLEGSSVPEKYFLKVVFKGDTAQQLPIKAEITSSLMTEEGVEEFLIVMYTDKAGKERKEKSEPLKVFEIFMHDLSEADKSKVYAIPGPKDKSMDAVNVARR